MNDNTNFMLAIIMSVLILIGFHYFYEVPRQQAAQARVQASTILQKDTPKAESSTEQKDRNTVIAETARLPFDNGRIKGSINLKGARFDDVVLSTYHEGLDLKTPSIVLLSPSGSKLPATPYYAELGWMAAEKDVKTPDADSIWKADKPELKPGSPVTLTWDNGDGLTFTRIISMDDEYVFTVEQRVANHGKADVTLYPFGLIAHHLSPEAYQALMQKHTSVHEGPLGVLDGSLREHSYKKLKNEGLITQESKGGWIGMTDIYWLASIIAPPDDKLTARFLHSTVGQDDDYQVDVQAPAMSVKAGAEASYTFHVFTGAKEVKKLDAYEKSLHAPMFDKAVDFGWFYMFAKPFFYVIDFLYRLLGNYGLAILAFTVLIRVAFYPMQESMFVNMARMKELQPEMNRIKEAYGSDPMKMNEKMTEIYKREKLNPLAGCLPILVQIPIFFALYKVLLVNIEMRHAPFYGWITDLSAPDPSNIFNLFGLIPWSGRVDFLFIHFDMHLGILPLLMGITMFVQQKLSPPPPDKTTAQMFLFMPIMFTFLLAGMPAGLVIYWTFSNLLAIAQQTLIKHRTKSKVKA